MPTITAAYVLDRAKLLLVDEGSVRWSEAELLGWLNDAQRDVVTLRPDLNQQIASLVTVAGTRQTLPADSIMLVDVYRNMGAAGTTPGRAVRKVDREYLDAVDPNWHASLKANEAVHYTYDLRAPKAFFVYPPLNGGTYLEVVYSKTPALLTAETDELELTDACANLLLDYVMFRAYAKDAEHPANAARAAAYRESYQASLDLKTQADANQVAAADAVRS